jgi:hypothetical protein
MRRRFRVASAPSGPTAHGAGTSRACVGQAAARIASTLSPRKLCSHLSSWRAAFGRRRCRPTSIHAVGGGGDLGRCARSGRRSDPSPSGAAQASADGKEGETSVDTSADPGPGRSAGGSGLPPIWIGLLTRSPTPGMIFIVGGISTVEWLRPQQGLRSRPMGDSRSSWSGTADLSTFSMGFLGHLRATAEFLRGCVWAAP